MAAGASSKYVHVVNDVLDEFITSGAGDGLLAELEKAKPHKNNRRPRASPLWPSCLKMPFYRSRVVMVMHMMPRCPQRRQLRRFFRACHEKLQRLNPLRIICRTSMDWDKHMAAAVVSGKLVVVHFSANWYKFCMEMNLLLDRCCRMYEDVVFLEVDVEDLQDLAMHHCIEAMPSFLFFKKGMEMYRILGANKWALINKIESLRSPDVQPVKEEHDESFIRDGGNESSVWLARRRHTLL